MLVLVIYGVFMSTLPLISVMVPCFNHSKYVRICLESIVRSYSGRLQIVFCDDCSADESSSLASLVLDDICRGNNGRVSVVNLRNEVNKGICYSLNRMIDHVSGDFIYLIASDDVLIDGALDKAVDIISSSDADVLVSDCSVIDSDGVILFDSAIFEYRRGFKSAYSGGFIIPELVMNWTLPGPSGLYRSSVYKKVGRYTLGLAAEDRDFYLRVMASCKVEFSFSPLALYRVHGNNTCHSSGYLSKIRAEMSKVNFSSRNLYGSSCFYFLYSFKFDVGFFGILSKIFRKSLYIFFKANVILVMFFRSIRHG